MRWKTQESMGIPLDQMADLMQRCHGDLWSREALAATLEGASGRAWTVEGAEPPPVGFVIARRIVDLVEIDLVGVVPEARRRGAAQFMLQGLIEAESRAQATEVRLELRESNAAARALYEGLDFVVVGERSRYYPDGENALLLTRSLI